MQKVSQHRTAATSRLILAFKKCSKVAGGILLLGLLLKPGLAFGAVPGASVNLAWDASTSAGVSGYRVYYGTASGNYAGSVAVGNVTATTFPGLVNGIPYFFAVVAHNASGEQ